MKTLTRVVWSEGMYLGPHHFQLQNRYFEDSIRHHIEQSWFEPWGLLNFQLDDTAIRNGRVSLLSAYGVFEDGLIFDMPACDEPPPQRNIEDVFSVTRDTLLILLAVPARRSGEANCDLQGESNDTRYRSVKRQMVDLLNGTDEKQIQLAAKNIRIITEDEVKEDLLTIPIARLIRDTGGFPAYDPNYIPPSLKITASERMLAITRRIIEVLEEKQKSVAKPRQSSAFQAGSSQMEVANFWFLHTINSSLTVLRHLYTSKRGHPEELFHELTRLAGCLCTFGLDSDPTQLPVYNHRDLQPCFEALDDHIRKHLEILVPTSAITIPLQLSGLNYYFGDANDTRVFGRARWFLGIRSRAGEVEVMNRSPYLVKVCSRAFVAKLVERAMPGLVLTHVPTPPNAILPRVDMQYFSISTDPQHPCWKHITDTKKVGVYIPNDLPECEVELKVLLQR